MSNLWSGPAELGRAISLREHPVVLAANARYRPWRKVKAIARQAGLDPDDAWRAVKLARSTTWRSLPLRRAEGGTFGICTVPALLESLHTIDHQSGGIVGVASAESGRLLTDEDARHRFIIRSLMEEAIESSRLEGAVTTRERALDLLRSGRTPASDHERMVANNYRAMTLAKRWIDRPLTIDLLNELQSTLTDGTMSDPGQEGRYRRPDEAIAVWDSRTNKRVFVPPPADGLRSRIEAVCEFANHEHQGEHFLHPIVKASILHFMIGYEHPYCDGNGRTARAVFYWHALRSGYWLFEYLVISELIRKSYAKYAQAYLNTDTNHD